MNNYFQYNSGKGVIPEDAIRISASQISKFFDSTSMWYRAALLQEQEVTTNRTPIELGNCVHAAAAMYHDSKSVDYTAISSYIASITNADVDKDYIRTQIQYMIPTIIDDYCSSNRHTHSEHFISYEVLPGIYAGGSMDAYDERLGLIVDYKTTSSKSVPTSFSRAYYFQLMTYAWVLRKTNRPITQLRLVYNTTYIDGGISEKTGKPLKSYPSDVTILNHLITEEDFALIDGCIKLIAESVQCWQQHPELRHILAQDYRLKELPKPKLFKD